MQPERICFAGASGVGKTTVAYEVSRLTRLPVREVEATECWGYPPGLVRQKCFADTFLARMGRGPGVYTNHPLSVYGYTVVTVGDDALLDEIERGIRSVECAVIVLYADEEELAERITRRLRVERRRALDAVGRMLEIHFKAQTVITEYARAHGYPVIDTTGTPPALVARRVLETLGLA